MAEQDKSNQHKAEDTHSRLARIESRLVYFMLSLGIDPAGARLDKPAQSPPVVRREKE